MTECIVSDKCTNGYGYAVIRVNGVKYSHHRWVWMQVHGPIPKGMYVCHTCDVRNCINVEHLFLGTAKDNTRDMVSKGRHRGQKQTHCKWGHEFTEENTRVYRGNRFCRECQRLIDAGRS